MDKLTLGLICIGAALSIGLAGFGAGIGMGRHRDALHLGRTGGGLQVVHGRVPGKVSHG